MRRVQCLVSGLFLLLASAELQAEVPAVPSVDVCATWTAAPWVPALSSLSAEFTLFSLEPGFVSSGRVKSWYLGHSPYLYTNGFWELGSEFVLGFGDPERPGFRLGLGTAFSQEQWVISVPLIVDLTWNIWLWDASLSPGWQTLVYGEGLISEVNLNAQVPLGKELPFLILGGYAGLGFTWTFFQGDGTGNLALQYGLRYGLGMKV